MPEYIKFENLACYVIDIDTKEMLTETSIKVDINKSKVDLYPEYNIDLSGALRKLIGHYGVVALNNGQVHPLYKNVGGSYQTSMTVNHNPYFGDDVMDSWVIYVSHGAIPESVNYWRPAILSEDAVEAKLKFGDTPYETAATVSETDEVQFINVSIAKGLMSDSFFSYGSTYSPSCTVTMTQCPYAIPGVWFRVEFKVDGVWQCFGAFKINSVPTKTSDEISFTGAGILESVFQQKNMTHTDCYLNEIQSITYSETGIPVVFDFLLDDDGSIKGSRNWQEAYLGSITEATGEQEAGGAATQVDKFVLGENYREIWSNLAMILRSNVVERNGVIHVVHTDTEVADDGNRFLYNMDQYTQEPSDMGYYYCASPVAAVVKPVVVSHPVSRVESSGAPKVVGFTSSLTGDSTNVNQYLTFGSSLHPDDYTLVKYRVDIEAEKMRHYVIFHADDFLRAYPWISQYMLVGNFAVDVLGYEDTPVPYKPLSIELMGYHPSIFPGSRIAVANGNITDYRGLVGNVTITYDGAISMQIDTPCDVQLSGANSTSSGTGASSTTGLASFTSFVMEVNDASAIKDKAITGAKIAGSTIEDTQIKDSSISGSKFVDGTIEGSKIKDSAITGAKIADSTIANSKIIDGEITGTKIADSTLTGAKIIDATIGYEKVDQSFITDLTADNAYIASLRAAVGEFGYLSAETAKLQYAEIDFSNVKGEVVGTSLIKDGAITDAKIASLSANKITAGTLDASKITVTNLNADNITAGTINGKLIGSGTVDLNKLSQEVPTKAYLDSVEKALQEQIDGAIETFTTDTIPTLNNYPANTWEKEDYDKHVGDVTYVVNPALQADGYTYRFTKDKSGTYSWALIKDSDVTKALQELIDVQGDISGIKQFDSEISSWKTDTDGELSSLKSRAQTIETSLGTKVDTNTFNSLKQTVEENSSSITTLSTTVSKKADSSTVTTLSNTVNSVKQTAESNSTAISSLQTTVSKKADSSTVETISQKQSSLEQDLDGFKSTVSETYMTRKWETISAATDMNNFKRPGNFLITGTITNGATSSWAYVIVEYASDTRIVQTMWHDTNADVQYRRTWYNTEWTQWYQMARSADITTAVSDAKSEIKQTTDSISTEVSKKLNTADFTGETMVSKINQTASTVAISAAHINLNGAVTANNYFKINRDGSMETTSGTIGGWTIQENRLASISGTDVVQLATNAYGGGAGIGFVRYTSDKRTTINKFASLSIDSLSFEVVNGSQTIIDYDHVKTPFLNVIDGIQAQKKDLSVNSLKLNPSGGDVELGNSSSTIKPLGNTQIGTNAIYANNATTLGMKYGTKNSINGSKRIGLIVGDVTASGNASYLVLGNNCIASKYIELGTPGSVSSGDNRAVSGDVVSTRFMQWAQLYNYGGTLTGSSSILANGTFDRRIPSGASYFAAGTLANSIQIKATGRYLAIASVRYSALGSTTNANYAELFRVNSAGTILNSVVAAGGRTTWESYTAAVTFELSNGDIVKLGGRCESGSGTINTFAAILIPLF